MKKFLTYLLILVSVAAIGFATYYLVQDKESFHLEQTVIYADVGDEFELDAYWLNKKRGSSYEIIVTDPTVIDYDSQTGKFKALSGGHEFIRFKTTNKNYANVACRVFVGDGSGRFPFYISSAEQFLKIGNEEIPNNIYKLEKAYKLINDIDLSEGVNETGYINPIGLGVGFKGNFNGDGYTIKNVRINPSFYNSTSKNAGLFEKIEAGGSVSNLKVDNILIEGEKLDYVGTIAGINLGIIERTEVTNATISVLNANATGGIVGLNLSGDEGSAEDGDYKRINARIDRVSADVKIGTKIVYDEESKNFDQVIIGTGGNVGGIAGENYAGIIVYSYSKGDVFINQMTTNYGGIAGYNTKITFTSTGNNKYFLNAGAHIKDSYSGINLYVQEAVKSYSEEEGFVIETNIGGLIGYNNNDLINDSATESSANKIIGNYYNYEALNFPETYNNQPITNKMYFGVGINYLDGVLETMPDEEYVVFGKTADELRDQDTFASHVKTELIIVQSGNDNIQTTKETIVTWKFGTLWSIENGKNDNMPILNYSNIEIQDEIYNVSDGLHISRREQLQDMRLDGNYIIIADIDLSQESYENDDNYKDSGVPWTPWTPIGSTLNPFVGTLQAAKYHNTDTGKKGTFTIYNLTLNGDTDEIQSVNGGLIGVASGERGGEIKNLVLEGVNSTGYENSGAIVGTNGYEVLDMKGETTFYDGLSISNVSVIDSVINGKVNVGAIAGVNYGSIIAAVVDDAYNDDELSVGSSEIKLTIAKNGANLGGIAGINYGAISRSLIKGTTSILADVKRDKDEEGKDIENTEVFNASVGGIAGSNIADGLITESGTLLITGDVKASKNIQGGVGGIVGYNSGEIWEVIVKKTSISGDLYNLNVYVGGLVGQIMQEGFVYGGFVNNSGVSGANAGGLVGLLEYSKPNTNFNYTFDDSDRIVNDTKNNFSICYSGTQDLAINGGLIGGIAGIVVNGIVSDVYALNTSLTSVNTIETSADNSNEQKISKVGVAAGIVGQIDYIYGGAIKAGVIQNVYVKATFAGEGESYAVSKSEFLLEPFIRNIPFTNKKVNRPAGFITNYLFADDTDGNAQHPKTSNAFSDAWNWIKDKLPFFENVPKAAVSSSDLKGNKVYDDFNFDFRAWDLYSGNYAKIKSLVNLENNITHNKVQIDATEHYNIVSQTNLSLNIPHWEANVKLGKDFTFEIIPTEKYILKNIVVKVNGIDIIPVNGEYTIENILTSTSIKITYEYEVAKTVKIEANAHYEISSSSNIVLSGSYWTVNVKSGEDVSFEILSTDKFTLKDVVVKVGDNVIEPVNGEYKLEKISADITVNIEYTFEAI